MRSGWSPPVMLPSKLSTADRSSNTWLCLSKSSISSAEMPTWRSRNVLRNVTSCPGALYGSGLSSTVSATLKMAVLAPMLRPSVITATAVSVGFLRNIRNAKRRWSMALLGGGGPSPSFGHASAMWMNSCAARGGDVRTRESLSHPRTRHLPDLAREKVFDLAIDDRMDHRAQGRCPDGDREG